MLKGFELFKIELFENLAEIAITSKVFNLEQTEFRKFHRLAHKQATYFDYEISLLVLVTFDFISLF